MAQQTTRDPGRGDVRRGSTAQQTTRGPGRGDARRGSTAQQTTRGPGRGDARRGSTAQQTTRGPGRRDVRRGSTAQQTTRGPGRGDARRGSMAHQIIICQSGDINKYCWFRRRNSDGLTNKNVFGPLLGVLRACTYIYSTHYNQCQYNSCCVCTYVFSGSRAIFRFFVGFALCVGPCSWLQCQWSP